MLLNIHEYTELDLHATDSIKDNYVKIQFCWFVFVSRAITPQISQVLNLVVLVAL